MNLEIAGIEIQDVEITEKGFIRKIDKRKRSRMKERIHPINKISRKNLRYLAWVYLTIRDSKYRARHIDTPILVEIVQELLGCNVQKAYDYAYTLLCLDF